MELIEQQRLLARLYTDAETRRLWLAEPEKFVEAFGVDGGTAEKLSTQVEFFARSLQRKRLKAVTTQFPATHQAMGRRFDELFFEYSRKPSPSGEDAVGIPPGIAASNSSLATGPGPFRSRHAGSQTKKFHSTLVSCNSAPNALSGHLTILGLILRLLNALYKVPC
jgi:hypothetical protein